MLSPSELEHRLLALCKGVDLSDIEYKLDKVHTQLVNLESTKKSLESQIQSLRSRCETLESHNEGLLAKHMRINKEIRELKNRIPK